MTDCLSNVIVNQVTEYRGDAQRNEKKQNTHASLRLRHNCARCKQQRVAGKDRRHHQTRLRKNDEEKYQVCPRFVIANNINQVLINVKNEVNQRLEKFDHDLIVGPQKYYI